MTWVPQRQSLRLPLSPNAPVLTRLETWRGVWGHFLRMHNGGEFGEGTKLLRRIILSPLDTMGIAAFNCFKQVLLHTRASAQEGVAMESGSCPGDQIFLPGWAFECVLLPYTAREWRWFLECTWNPFSLFMLSLQPGVLGGPGLKAPLDKVAIQPEGLGDQVNFLPSCGSLFPPDAMRSSTA